MQGLVQDRSSQGSDNCRKPRFLHLNVPGLMDRVLRGEDENRPTPNNKDVGDHVHKIRIKVVGWQVVKRRHEPGRAEDRPTPDAL